MGVHQFNQAFGSCAIPVKKIKSVIAGKRIVIDVNITVCAAIKAMYKGTHLTGPNGVPTAGINTLLSNVIKYQKAGATIIGVCDNPKPNPFKSAEYEKRRAQRKVAEEKARVAETDEEKKKHEATAWTLNDVVVQDAQKLLNLLGVECHIAPEGREAEQYAAEMIIEGAADILISNDTDALMFGAHTVIMVNNDKKTKNQSPWIMYKLSDILETHDIDMHVFQKMCIALGTDFASKTKGVGPKTVFTSGKNKPLSEEQEKALAYVQSKSDSRADVLEAPRFDKDALLKWLVESKGFNAERLVKKLKHL